MRDELVQKLHRRWIASGDPADEAALLYERVRLGQLEERHLEIISWLRGLAKRPVDSAVLVEAGQRLSAREAFVLGFDLASEFQPSYLDSFSADLVAFRRDPAGLIPADRDAARAAYMLENPGLRVNWDPVPELLRAIANSARPIELPWILNLIPGVKSLGDPPLKALWRRLVSLHPATDLGLAWRAALEGLLETILEDRAR